MHITWFLYYVFLIVISFISDQWKWELATEGFGEIWDFSVMMWYLNVMYGMTVHTCRSSHCCSHDYILINVFSTHVWEVITMRSFPLTYLIGLLTGMMDFISVHLVLKHLQTCGSISLSGLASQALTNPHYLLQSCQWNMAAICGRQSWKLLSHSCHSLSSCKVCPSTQPVSFTCLSKSAEGRFSRGEWGSKRRLSPPSHFECALVCGVIVIVWLGGKTERPFKLWHNCNCWENCLYHTIHLIRKGAEGRR